MDMRGNSGASKENERTDNQGEKWLQVLTRTFSKESRIQEETWKYTGTVMFLVGL